MSFRSACAAALSTLALATLVGPLRAQSSPADSPRPSPPPPPPPTAVPPRVLLIAASDTDPVAQRVAEELALLGYAVERVPAELGREEPDKLMDRYGAVAWARTDAAARRVELWVPDELAASAGSVGMALIVSADDDDELLALRSIELLRGRLLPVERLSRPPKPAPPTEPVPTSPSQPPAPPTTPSPPDAAPRRSRLRLYAAPALELSPGGFSPTLGIRAGAEVGLVWRLSAGLHAVFPTLAPSVETERGAATVRVLPFGAGLDLELTPKESVVGAFVGLGLDAAPLFYEGSAVAPLVGQAGTSWAAAPYAQFGGRVPLHPLLALRLDCSVHVLAPEPTVRFAGVRVATFGVPLVIPALGLELTP